jgi:hypothetical protein
MSDIGMTLNYTPDGKFIIAAYKDCKVLIVEINGHINATYFCEVVGVKLCDYMQHEAFKPTCELIRKEFNIDVTITDVNNEWKDVANCYKGYYMHYHHINKILSFCINPTIYADFSVLLKNLYIRLVFEASDINTRYKILSF